MSFTVRINGEDVWSTELQVDQVALQSAKGEAGRIGVSYDTAVVDLIVSEVSAGGPVRLDHLEAVGNRAASDIREGETAVSLSPDRYDAPDGMHGFQGEHTYTARKGGGGNEPHIPTPAENAASDQRSQLQNEDNVQRLGEDEGTGSDVNPVNAALEDKDTVKDDAADNTASFSLNADEGEGETSATSKASKKK